MRQNKRTVIVGAFIFFGLAILLAAILVLGNQKKGFGKTITLSAVFNDVSGLQKGNNVWFSGVKVGVVKTVKLVSGDKVEVEMRVDAKSKEYIHKDARAKIGSDGLIGNKLVIIYGGTQGMVASGDVLKTEAPISSAEMMGTLNESNKNLSQITTDFKIVSRRLAEGQGTVGKLLTDDALATQLEVTSQRLQVASANIILLASNLAEYTAKFQQKGTLMNDLVSDTSFFKNLKEASLQIQQASENAKVLTSNLSEVSYKLKDSSNVAGVLFNDKESAARLRVAIENVQSGTKKFDEDMEALQHNFLFRGFFRKRAKQQKQQAATQQSTKPAGVVVTNKK